MIYYYSYTEAERVQGTVKALEAKEQKKFLKIRDEKIVGHFSRKKLKIVQKLKEVDKTRMQTSGLSQATQRRALSYQL